MRFALFCILPVFTLVGQDTAGLLTQFRYRPERARPGQVLHYRKSNLDGSRPLLLSVYTPVPERVEVLKVENVGRYLALVSGRLDWRVFSLVEGRSYNRLERGEPRLQAEFRLDPIASRMDVHIAKAHAGLALPFFPTHIYNFDFTSLNLAWPHLAHPDQVVKVGVVDPDFEFMKTRFKPEGEQPGLFTFKGMATFTPAGEEVHGGVPCLKYTAAGSAFKDQSGTLWVDKAEGHWVEFRHSQPDNPDWNSFRLELVGRERMDSTQWEAFKASRIQRAKDLLREFGDD